VLNMHSHITYCNNPLVPSVLSIWNIASLS
jgi:hypothetical protein